MKNITRMENYTSIADLRFENKITQERFLDVKRFFNNLDHIDILDSDQNHIKLKYSPFEYSSSFLEGSLENLGIIIQTEEKKKSVWQKFISYLARENKKNFGTKQLDCCEIKK